MVAGGGVNAEAGPGAVTIKFPRPMKRGAKVRTGPCAQIIQFPGFLSGSDLCNHWAWLSANHREWENDALDGRYDGPEDWETTVRIAKSLSPGLWGRELDDQAMRSDIAEWRNIVSKRIEVKRHLRELGIDGMSTRSAEQALLALSECVQSQALPSCA